MTRNGRQARRQLEFDVIRDQVTRRKDAFMARLSRWIAPGADGCQLWTGAHDGCGYGALSFKYKGKHVKINVPRVMLILKLGRPIKKGYEAGHTCAVRACCAHIIEQHWRDNNAERDKRNGQRDDTLPF